MNCRRCKREGKDVEMESYTNIIYPDPANPLDKIKFSNQKFKTEYNLKCPECGWSVSV